MKRAASTISEKMIKVDHAGENGAVSIYRAQALICRLRAPSLLPDIQHFLSHELNHREIFKEHLQRRNIRRCVSYTICGFGGYALGLVTGLAGKQAVHATTYAVERVVLEHLQHQLAYLETRDLDAHQCVSRIFNDEQAHHDLAAAFVDENLPLTKFLIRVVGFSTECVIRFGMR